MKRRFIALVVAIAIFIAAWPVGLNIGRSETGDLPGETTLPAPLAPASEAMVEPDTMSSPEISASAEPTEVDTLGSINETEDTVVPDQPDVAAPSVEAADEDPPGAATTEQPSSSPEANTEASQQPAPSGTSMPENTDAAAEPTTNATAEVTPETMIESTTKPALSATAEPEDTKTVAAEPTASTTAEVTPETMIESTTKPASSATAEPEDTKAAAAEPTANTTSEAAPEATVETTTEPGVEPDASAGATAEPTNELAAEPTLEPTAEVSPEPDALNVLLITEQKYAYANKTPVEIQMEIVGGTAEYAALYSVESADQLVHEESIVYPEPGAYSFSHMPEKHGIYSIRVVVTDAIGTQAESAFKIPVAARDNGNAPDWITKVRSVELTEDWRENIVNIASTQVGYRESDIDFIIDENGVKHSYTFYGEWYDSSYAEWCGMFISYCLNRAGISDYAYPYEANCIRWRDELKDRGAYMNLRNLASIGETYLPAAGDLVFFNFSDKYDPEHVGIVEAVDGDTISVIEGNVEGCVVRREYALDDETIVGYANTKKLMLQAGVELPSPEPEGTAEPTLEAAADVTVSPEVSTEAAPERSVEPSAEPTNSPEASVEATVEPNATQEVALDATLAPDAQPEASEEPTVETTPESNIADTAVPTAEPDSTVEAGVEPTFPPEGSAEPGTVPEATAEPTSVPEGTVEATVEPTTAPEGTPEPGTEAIHVPEYICGIEAHAHEAGCCDAANILICALEAHEHAEACVSAAPVLTESEREAVQNVIHLIDALPSSMEIEKRLLELETDEEVYMAYYAGVANQGLGAYIAYQGLEDYMQAQVSNLDKLMESGWIWSARILADSNATRFTVYQSNDFTNYGYNASTLTMLVYGQTPDQLANHPTYQNNFKTWTAVIVEEVNGVLKVEAILPNTNGEAKRYEKADTENGFVLLYYGALTGINVGDTVFVNYDYKTKQTYDSSGVGQVAFYPGVNAKSDITYDIGTLRSADTSEIVKINLYNYGKSINDKYKSNNSYPGFQYPDGVTSVVADFGSDMMDFGDNIVADFTEGIIVTNKGGKINALEDANKPLSGVMMDTLVDGFPAVDDGTADGLSMEYLFSNRKNSGNISGLFQYDEDTGRYYYNSRNTHAQYSGNKFTLYNARITSNYLMYPFGNFLPFNDIERDTTKASDIRRDYFLTIAATAQKKYNNGQGDVYRKLALALENYVYLMDKKMGNKNWSGGDALNGYFEAAGLADRFSTDWLSDMKIYNIDYDEETDFFFGMDMEMTFMQPKGGMTGPKGDQEMIFKFTGDDDVWVYIDDVLFLDLSGIHRHVGGEIDFVNGEVRYQALSPSDGDVGGAYETVEFADLVKDTGVLNVNGTFKDYSTHTLKFYYMERGSGSSVCRMEFNFPLLRENTISVTKELSADEQDKLELLGNPDFRFQALKADDSGNRTAELFIAGDTAYKVYDENGAPVEGSFKTDSNGVFTLKAGQTAEFAIPENSGYYYVRELLNPTDFEQYGTIYVDGTSQTTSYETEVGNDSFKGVDSNVKNASDGSTVFNFNNQITFAKLGRLSIEKKLKLLEGSSNADKVFKFEVRLDGELLPKGTGYTVGGSARTVGTAGVIELKAGQSAVISNILSGTRYSVEEIDAAGYDVLWDDARGTIVTEQTATAECTNEERVAGTRIPVEKRLANPDGLAHSYSFRLAEVTDSSGATVKNGGHEDQMTVSLGADEASGTGEFTLNYNLADPDLADLPKTCYYKLTEIADAGDASTEYDARAYIVTVTINEDGTIEKQIDGSASGEDDALTFTNRLVGVLTLSKTVAGPEASTEKVFDFTITLQTADGPANGTYSYARSDGSSGTLSFENGEASVRLKHDQRITIYNLPIGAEWSITETAADGYYVEVQTDGGELTPGATASGSIQSDVNAAAFTNTARIELPTTGGSGNGLYTAGGLLMISSALILLYCNQKHRKEDSNI